MRLWLRDSERRPDPVPVATNDARAILIGLGLWVVGLVVLLGYLPSLRLAGNDWFVWAAVAGIALGIVGLVHTVRRERETDRQRDAKK